MRLGKQFAGVASDVGGFQFESVVRILKILHLIILIAIYYNNFTNLVKLIYKLNFRSIQTSDETQLLSMTDKRFVCFESLTC